MPPDPRRFGMSEPKPFDNLGYQFENPDLLREALTHASSSSSRGDSNERQEFLGDAVLGFVVCEYLFHTYPRLAEGELTKIKSAVVSRRTCAKVSRRADFAKMLTLGKGMTHGVGLPNSIAAAVFESLIAAIYLDGGMAPARVFILHHLTSEIQEAEASSHQRNFKSVLQHFAQKHLAHTPHYHLIDERGPDHVKEFCICAGFGDKRFDAAWAASKKEAEQQAALQAMVALGIAHMTDRGEIEIYPEEEHEHRAAAFIGQTDA